MEISICTLGMEGFEKELLGLQIDPLFEKRKDLRNKGDKHATAAQFIICNYTNYSNPLLK